jgi:hypothetical protein
MDTKTPTLSGLEPLLSIEELSEYLHVPIRTLYDWRLARDRVRFTSDASFVSDVHDWLRDQRELEPGRSPDGR